METITQWLIEQNMEPGDEALYIEACTHSSYANENTVRHIKDNERLEFVGDAVLQLWSAESLYNLEPPLKEGKMSLLRSQVVCEKSLASINEKLGWYRFLRLGVGEEKSGGRMRKSLMADQFEAVLGAIYLDQGYFTAFEFLDRTMLPLIYEKREKDEMDYKTRLQEHLQSDHRSMIQYRLLDEHGPSNAPVFTIGAYLDGICLGVGTASSKRKAEQQAAKEAYEKLAS